jgi:membrane protein
MGNGVKRILTAGIQRTVFSLEQFSRHEMANHAAAGAYGFLLSAGPALLVILYLSSIAFGGRTIDLSSASSFLEPYFGTIADLPQLATLTTRPLAGFAGIFGFVNLIWTSRLFILSIQRGIRVVYSDVTQANPVRENILTFAAELLLLLSVIGLIAFARLAGPVVNAIRATPLHGLLSEALSIAASILPLAILWLFVFLTYHGIPARKPRYLVSAISALLCTAAYLLIGLSLNLFLNIERYGLLYGVMGNLIVGLVKVYAFFWLYFFFAELSYTIQFFDTLLFTRFHKLESASKAGTRLERSLFAEPERLERHFARYFKAGDLIFARYEEGREAFYLYRGTVHIHLDEPSSCQAKSIIREGDFFGELAPILDEQRSAWAVAATDCIVFLLPPELFKRFITNNAESSQHLLELMANRIKANDDYLRQAGTT